MAHKKLIYGECSESRGKLLHIAFIKQEYQEPADERMDISHEDEPLQVAVITPACGRIFPAHKHIENIRRTTQTQEVWFVVSGIVFVRYYDVDGKPLFSIRLHAGDCSITYRGGHSYEILEEGTLVYEVKNGPYKGREKDKVIL